MARWGLWTHGSKLPCIVETLAFQSILGRNQHILWDLDDLVDKFIEIYSFLQDLVDNFWWTTQAASFSIWLHKALLSSLLWHSGGVTAQSVGFGKLDSDAPFRRILSWHGPTVTWQLKKVTTKLYTQKYQKMYEVEIIWNNCHRKEAFRIWSQKTVRTEVQTRLNVHHLWQRDWMRQRSVFTSWNMTPQHRATIRICQMSKWVI